MLECCKTGKLTAIYKTAQERNLKGETKVCEDLGEILYLLCGEI